MVDAQFPIGGVYRAFAKIDLWDLSQESCEGAVLAGEFHVVIPLARPLFLVKRPWLSLLVRIEGLRPPLTRPAAPDPPSLKDVFIHRSPQQWVAGERL